MSKEKTTHPLVPFIGAGGTLLVDVIYTPSGPVPLDKMRWYIREGLLEQHHALFRLTDKGKALMDALEEKVPC